MVGDGEDERKRGLCVEMRVDNTLPESLANAVRGDQTKAAKCAGTNQLGGALPPERHVVDGLRQLLVGAPKSLGVTLAEAGTHGPVPQKWRISHHVIRLRPGGFSGIHITED